MNVLILTDYYPPDKAGGVGQIALGLAEAYRALGHRVVVLTTGERRTAQQEPGVFRSSRRLALGVLLNNLLALRIIRRERIQLVHLHQSSTTLFLAAKRLFDVFPFVVSSLQVSYLSEAREIRSVRVAKRMLRPTAREYVERYLLAPAHVVLDFVGYALSDRVTVVSRDNEHEMRRTFGRLLHRDLVVIPNGVPEAEAAGSTFRDASVEERLRGKVVVGYAGVFRARKRVANLVLAMADVAASCPDAALLLVGGGRGYEAALCALVREQGLEDRVIFTGSVPFRLVRYYVSLMEVFCIVSSYEGMPMAMLEAMKAGKPVVATDRFGMRDVLEGGGGITVPPDDVNATAVALKALVRDPSRRAVLGAEGQAHVERSFAWVDIARRYLALMESK